MAGEDQSVCCVGCQAVANLINGSDLSAFYRQRTEFAPKPDDEQSSTASWYTDASWLEDFQYVAANGERKVPLLVSGMSCAACTWLIEQMLLRDAAATQVDVNLSESRVTLTLAESMTPSKAVATLEQLGYRVRPWRADTRIAQLRQESRQDMRRLGVAGIGMMQVGMFSIALHAGAIQGIDSELQQLLRWFSVPLALLVVAYSGQAFFQNAWSHLKARALVMDSSVSLALLLATLASLWATWSGSGETYFDSVTMFVFFLLLARFVEKRLRQADLLALVRLEDSLPEFVLKQTNNQFVRTPRDTVALGDIVQVPNGDTFPFDGHVARGDSTVDESIFNGESLPRSIGVNDNVYSGTVNTGATVEIAVDSTYTESRLALLQDNLDTAQGQKPAYLKLIDQLAARFVLAVVVASGLTWLYWVGSEPERALWSALAVLVVACPCALSLATPAALAAATSSLRRRGIRVRGEYATLATADAKSVLIDKTGTLTETTLELASVLPDNCISQAQLLKLATSLQQFSNHPAATAFHHQPAGKDVEHVTAVVGRGMQGVWNGKLLRLGSEAFVGEVCSVPAHPDGEQYWLALGAEQQWLGWLGLGEALRYGADSSLQALQSKGKTVEIVSGDRRARVERIAKQLNVDFTAECSPAYKLELLTARQKQGQVVMAIGDGLNDAPFLAAADASVAVASATGLAKAQADFVITEEDLSALTVIVDLSLSTRRLVRQNLLWAACYNAAAIPFAAAGFVPPWLAAIGMSLSSLVVVLNALRLRRF